MKTKKEFNRMKTKKQALEAYAVECRRSDNNPPLPEIYFYGEDLSGANLTGANLNEASLWRANLTGADLAGANLRRANLTDAVLSWADLTGANLTGASLTGADLTGADLTEAYLLRTNLEGAKLPSNVPVVKDLEKKILKQIESNPACFDMDSWHSECGTVHCLAGWTIALAGEEGKKLELDLHTSTAGTLIYQKSEGFVPDFYSATKEKALADLRERVAKRGNNC